MEVILKETISSLGKAGDIVNVAPGYARNYLLPYGKAILADPKNVAQMERQRAAILERAAKELQELEALASQLDGVEVTLPVRVGEEGKLYGSVTAMDIAKAVEEQGFTLDKRKVQLGEPIRSLGDYDVQVKLAPDLVATLKVHVVPMEDQE